MGNNKRYWLFQASGWGIFMLVNVFFAITFDRLNWLFILRLGIFIMMGLLLTHLMRFITKRVDLLLQTVNRQLMGLLAFTLAFAIVIGVLEVLIFKYFNLLPPDDSRNVALPKAMLVNSFNAFIYFFIWSSIYFMYHFIEKTRRQQVDTLKLEALVKSLELKTIKAHINPHFIFNALNSIRALIDENPERARTAITEMSNILRSSMKAENLELVPLAKELDIVKDYLALENMRFEDRLKVEYDIDEDTLDMQVPPMMLQTLVENAIKHGISKQINGGVVKIISDFKDEYLELSVQNTGRLNGQTNKEARPPARSDHSGGDDQAGRGFGLAGTISRINLMFGDKANFEIRQIEQGMVEAKVHLPVTVTT